MIAAVLLSLISLLPGQLAEIIPAPGDPVWVFPTWPVDREVDISTLPWNPDEEADWEQIDRDCNNDPECLQRRRQLEDDLGIPTPDIPPVADDGDSGPPPTSCTPREPSRPEPDVQAMPLRVGTIVHEAGEGPVLTGMDTEFRWRGPEQISWTQPAVPGLREDCTLVPGEPARFTASLQHMVFDFEVGDQLQYEVDVNDPTVTHRYEEAGYWTVCVYAAYEIPAEGFVALTQVAELDHDVVEARSTLVE
jgi:hypothetical protein